MHKVAFVTYTKFPTLWEGDRLLIEPLRQRQIEVVPVVWDDSDVVWRDFDAVVLRSCWDYHHYPVVFGAWLAQLEAAGVPLFNPAALVRWNMDKIYLRDLAAKGVSIVPSLWFEPDAKADLPSLLAEQKWKRAVIKPRMSAGAENTWQTSQATATADNARFQAQLAQPGTGSEDHLDGKTGGVIVQRFMEEINTGEWSLLYFRGIFSHAALKRPAADDFYVQGHLGGSSEALHPPPALIRQGAEIIRLAMKLAGEQSGKALSAPPLYARVDGLNLNETLCLMELELIEPVLFLEMDAPAAIERCADAIRDTVFYAGLR